MRGLLSFDHDTEILAIIVTVFKSEEVLNSRISIWVLLVVAFSSTVLSLLLTTELSLDAGRTLARE